MVSLAVYAFRATILVFTAEDQVILSALHAILIHSSRLFLYQVLMARPTFEKSINKCCFTVGSQIEPESHCYPHELVKQLTGYENWSVGVELALAFNLALVMALTIYMMCTKKSFSSSCFLNCCSGSNERETNHDYDLLTQTSANLPPPIGAEKSV